MTQGRRKNVRVAGARLAYEVHGSDHGSDKPLHPIVMLHANYVDSRLWDGDVPWLSRDRRVIRYDMVGFGHSLPERTGEAGEGFDAADRPIPVEDLGHYLDETLDERTADEDLKDLLDHLEVDKAVLLGLELGAEVAAGFAVEHPRRVAALILVSPILPDFLPFSEEWAEWAERRAEPWAEKAGIMDDTLFERMGATGDPKPMIDLFMSDAAFAPRDEAARRRLRSLMEETPATFLNPQARTGVPGGRASEPVAKRLAGLRAPTLVVAGGEDEQEVLETVSRLSRRMPLAQARILEGAGRFPNLDAPERFRREVSKFLDELQDR
jgi:pimeloyl-ACP methyl ester carboxylesterase